MGNCQAAEAATVMIEHPSGRLERIYWSLSASQLMASNPGHYVAALILNSKTTHTHHSSSSSSSSSTVSTAPVKYLKLLRPDDTLHIGRVYRLVSFQEVLKEFASKKHAKLSRLVAPPAAANKEEEEERKKLPKRQGEGRAVAPDSSAQNQDQVVENHADAAAAAAAAEADDRRRISGPVPRPHQWRPALQSIAEIGTRHQS